MFVQDADFDWSGTEKTIYLLQPDPGKQLTVQRLKKCIKQTILPNNQLIKVQSIKKPLPILSKKRVSVKNDDMTLDKRKKGKNQKIDEPIQIEDIMKRQSIGIDDLLQYGDNVIWTENSFNSEDDGTNQFCDEEEVKLLMIEEEGEQDGENKLTNSVFNYYRQEKYQLQVIEDGNFNNGGVSLQIDFEKRIIKAVKQVKNEEFFKREIRALQEFQKKNCIDAAAVSLRLLDYDTNNLIFSQKAGFISFKQIIKIVQFKKLQEKYKLPFEYFITKQMFFLLKKLDTMNNTYKVAHSDIKPNNIVIGFDFIPFFIDLGGAIYIEEEPNEYLTLCTPTFVPQKYINKDQFDEQSIKQCEKQSLMLMFLFMLCRKYKNLIDSLKDVYSQDLIEVFEMSIIREDLNGVDLKIKEILDKNLVSYIENLEQILLFLNELKQFDYFTNQNLYIIKEWDQFNVNILKLFPSLLYEIDLLQITQSQKIYDYFCQNSQLDIFIDIHKPFYINFLNIFLDLSLDSHTLKFEHFDNIKIQDKYRISDLIQKKNGCLTIRINFGIFNANKEDQEDYQMQCSADNYLNQKIPPLNFEKVKTYISCLQIQSLQETLDFKNFLGLNTSFNECKIQELKIKCKDISINLFQDFLNKQIHLRCFHMHIKDYQYKITFPELAHKNQLHKLKSNFQIINIDSVIDENQRSLLDLEIVINAGEDRSLIYTKLPQLHFLSKLSLRVNLIRIPNQIIQTACSMASISMLSGPSSMNSCSTTNIGQIIPRKSSNPIPNLSQNFYDLLSSVFSKMRIPIIKLNFSECFLNSQDIIQINRCIKSTINVNAHQSVSLPHTLKLNMNLQGKPIDDNNTRMILISLLQTKISRIKVSINNSPLYNNLKQESQSLSRKASKSQAQLSLFFGGYKNDSLKQLSLQLSNFNVNLQQLVSNLTACEKYKLVLNGYNNTFLANLENLVFLNDQVSLVIKPSEAELDKQFQHFSFTNYQISTSLKSKLQKQSIKFNRKKHKVRTFMQTFKTKQNTSTTQEFTNNDTFDLTNLGNYNDEQSPLNNVIDEKNQKLEDYIDFKSNRLFSINLYNFKGEINNQVTGIQDSLSGLIECFKMNQQLKTVNLNFNTCSISKMIQQGFIQNLFDSFKYNEVCEELSINLSGIQIESLKCLHGCLSYNETLKSLALNLQNCDLSPESLMEIAEAILSNDHVNFYKFNLLDNPQFHYPHTIIHELKGAKPQTEIILLFNDVRDYDLIFSSSLIHYSSQTLQSLEIKQKPRKQLKYLYPEYESLDNNLNTFNFSNLSKFQAANQLNKNQSSLLPNSPNFNHRKYSQQHSATRISNNQPSTPSLYPQFSNSSQFPSFNQNMQVPLSLSSFPNLNIQSRSNNSGSFSNNFNNQGNHLQNNYFSQPFSPKMTFRNGRMIQEKAKEDSNISQFDYSNNNINQNYIINLNSSNTNNNNNEAQQSVSTQQNSGKSKAIWISRKVSQSRFTQYSQQESASGISRQQTGYEQAQRKQNNPSTFLELHSPLTTQNNNVLNNLQSMSNIPQSGQILVFDKSQQNITLVIEENQNVIALEEFAKKNQTIQDISFVLHQSTLNLKYFLSGLKFNNNLSGLSITLSLQPQKSDLKTIIDIIVVLKEKLKRLSLNFSRLKLGQENIKNIIENIYQNPILEEIELDFSHNMIQPNTAKQFALLKESKVKKLTLKLGNNFLGIDGTKYICDIIEKNSQNLCYLSLELDFNFIGNSALSLIQNALTKNKNLNTFQISMKGNQIKQEFAYFIECYLQTHPTIKSFAMQTENCTINP